MPARFLAAIFVLMSVIGWSQDDSLLIQSLKNKKRYRIAGLKVEGADNTDRNVIMLLSGISEGEEIMVPGERVSDVVKKLWKQGLFEDIQVIKDRVEGDRIYLTIKVVERPRLTKFAFKGDVRRGEADDLRNKIKLMKERVLTDYLIGNIRNTVRGYYVDKGYYFAKVETVMQRDTTTKTPHAILTIRVNKGKKVRIQEVNIHGNTVLKSWQIRRKLEDSKQWRWYNPFNSAKYLEENLRKDLPAISAKYQAKGYRDARVVKDTVRFLNDHRVAIDITVEEGHKYYFGRFKWYGNTKYRSGQLDTVLGIKAGEVYDQSKLEQKLYMNPHGFDISSLYLDDGYLFFQIHDQESNVHNDTIDFDILMYEGKQATVNKVSVKGNDKTNDHVIYREITTRPGQLFRRSSIMYTNRALAQLNYFDPEKLNVTPTPNPADGTVDIEYTVEEKPSDMVELSGGWGGSQRSLGQQGLGVIGTLGVTFNNFSARSFFKKQAWRPLPSGDGQRLSVRAQTNGVFYQSYNFSFTEPWLGGKKPNSLTVSAFHSLFSNGQKKFVTVGDVKQTNLARQSMSIFGTSIGLGRRLRWPDNYFNMFTNLSYNYYDLFNYGSAFIFGTGYANDINLGFNISRNSVDAPIFSKTGSNFVFSGQFTPPYSSFNGKDYAGLSSEQRYRFIEYQKYKFTAEWFTQLTNQKVAEGKEARNLVLRTKIGYGFLAYYNKRTGFSPFERFYMGGSGLSGMQNFVAREIIGLRGYVDNSVSSTYGDPIVARYTMELRYPVSLNPSATIFVLGFAEAGNTWANFRSFNPFQVKRSAGVGVRFALPMFGLLGLDYGWGFDNIPWAPGSGNGKGQFHFTIGGTLGEL